MIKYGLKNVFYALVTEAVNPTSGEITVTYGTPKSLAGAVNLSLKANTEKTEIPADDIPDYVEIYDNKGYDGELEVLEASDDFRKDVLKEVLDDNGVMIETADAKPVRYALLFEFNGDKKKTRHVMYNCSATKPDIESSTTGEKIEHKSDKLTFTSRPAKDTGHIKGKAYSDNEEYENWFKTVYIPTFTPSN